MRTGYFLFIFLLNICSPCVISDTRSQQRIFNCSFIPFLILLEAWKRHRFPFPCWTNKARVEFVLILKLSGGIKTI